MKFSASRETVLKPLSAVIGVVERRQTMPILAHVLIDREANVLQQLDRLEDEEIRELALKLLERRGLP